MSGAACTPTVYYDGSCPVCTAEIAAYRRAGRGVDFADVSQGELPYGVTREAAMARFHYRSDDGRVLSGAAAFAALWLRLSEGRPLLRKLARLANTKPAIVLGEAAYRAFLPLRPMLQRIVRKRMDRHA